MIVKLLILALFFAVTIAVGLKFRGASDVNGFVLGGRSVGPWLSAFSYGTSYFSAVIFVGYAGQFGWRFGLSASWIGVFNALVGSLLAWLVLGKRTRRVTQELGSATLPDFFEKRYGSRALKLAASLIIFVFMIPYTASLYNGLSRVFAVAFDVDFRVCLVVMAALTGVYAVAGGYMASAVSNLIQGVVMLFGIAAVIIAVLRGQGGFVAAVAALPKQSLLGPDPASLLGVIVLTSLGTWGLPQMLHKFYAIRDERSIRSGAVISTVFALVVGGGAYFLGGFGQLFDSPAIHSASGAVIYDAVIPRMVSSLPDVLVGIVLIMIMSASMSTLSSLVMTSASSLTLDLIDGGIVRHMSEKAKLLCLRVLLVFFIVLSAAIAVWQYGSASAFIAQLMGISWGAMAGSFLAPFLFGLYAKKHSAAGVWACFIFAVGLTVSNMFLKFIPSPVNAGAIAIVAPLAIMPLVSAASSVFSKALHPAEAK